MHDIRQIRDNPAGFDAALTRRGEEAWSEDILTIDKHRREAIQQAEAAQAERNRASKDVGAAKASGDEAEFERLRQLMADKKREQAELEEKAKIEQAQLEQILLSLPNTPLDEVPDGAGEEDNVELRRWGNLPNFAFDPKEHYQVAGAIPGLDFETAAKTSGSRFVMLRGAMARLHRALSQFMIDTHVDRNGLSETWVPVLVREEAMLGTDKLPKFGHDSYQTTNDWWLIPTSEVPLTYSVAGQILASDDLPIRLTAQSQCFRSEAGSAGKDTAGMLRQHQFEKVEMVSITRPEDSRAELDRMTGCAEALLEALGLPYRTVVLCTGDMGFGAERTHDIEVWLPGQNTFREISSCSTTGAFQARRMNARYRPTPDAKPEFVHTLNGSGLAVGRCLIAVVENGQQEDGSIALPPVLAPYLRGAAKITAEGILG
ncbi:MAG: serine--tRNA ligase [Pseudomonadota bacterium]